MNRCVLLTVILVWATASFAQNDTAESAAVGPGYADDTLLVRKMLDAVGRDTVSAVAVTKKVDGRVGYLDLSNPSLMEEGMKVLPETVGALTGLKQLILNKNILETLPVSVSNLVALEVLDVGGNELQAVPSWIGKLQNLRKLDLRNNEFDKLPAALYTLANLEHLQMWGNRLTTLSEDIGKLTNLKELYLQRNRLTMLPKAIAAMEKLEYIDYDYNSLCKVDPVVEQWLLKRDKKYLQLQKCR